MKLSAAAMGVSERGMRGGHCAEWLELTGEPIGE